MCHLYLVLIPVFLFVILGPVSYNITLWSVVTVMFFVLKFLTHPAQITYLKNFNLLVRFSYCRLFPAITVFLSTLQRLSCGLLANKQR